MFIKKVLLGALGWYVVFLFFHQNIIDPRIFNIVYATMANFALVFTILPSYLISTIAFIVYECLLFPTIFAASAAGIIMLEGRRCSLKETLTASLCWLLNITLMWVSILLWADDVDVSDLFLRTINIRQLIMYSNMPVAILGALTYSGLRAWFSRNKSQGLKV